MDLNEQIIDSIRETREDVKRMSEVLARHTEKLEHFFGNGQPGEYTILKQDVDKLKESHSRLHGALKLGAFLWSIIWGAIELAVHWKKGW